MSGFCNSTGTLRGPGSVPPRPGRIGCGVPAGALGVCALAAATVAIPTAAVLRMARRERLMTLFSLCNESIKPAQEPARCAGSARQPKTIVQGRQVTLAHDRRRCAHIPLT